MTFTLDTNLLIYALDDSEPAKQQTATVLVDGLKSAGGPIGLQVCGEFYNVVAGRLKQPSWAAAQAARNLMNAFPVFNATCQSMERAFAEAATGRFSFWDANLLSAAEAAGCTCILSEDMQDGARLGRIEVVHPFGPDGPSARALQLLGKSS